MSKNNNYHNVLYMLTHNHNAPPQIHFIHGVMGSGKTACLLESLKNYDLLNKKYILLTSAKDDRFGVGRVVSRNGDSREAIAVTDNDSILDGLKWNMYDLDYIIIDEWQFFSKKHADEIIHINLNYGIDIYCYGLMFDYRGILFDSVAKIIEAGAILEEIPYPCVKCGKRATMHLRKINDKYVFDGEQINVGDTDTYESVCSVCYRKEQDKCNK